MRLEHKPKYETKLYSDGSTIKFRPFIVEEERNLLMALQSESPLDVIATIKDIVGNCTKTDADKLPYFELEQLFLKIRSKSVGELVEMVGTCDCKDDARTTFTVNLDNVCMHGELLDPVIPIVDSDYFAEFRYTTTSDIFNTEDQDGIDFIASMVTKVWNSDEVFDDPSLAESKEFLLSLSSEQYKDIDAFFKGMPSIRLSHTWHCNHCGKAHDMLLTGIEDFFV